jgi:CRP-like cAMP-binding protein
MLKTLADLVRGLDDHLADRTLLDLRARVIKYLISAAGGGRQGATAAPPGELRVDLCVSQTDLARLVGGSRQHVNRIILDLEREGAIRRHGPRVVAIRPALLQPVTSGPAYRGR